MADPRLEIVQREAVSRWVARPMEGDFVPNPPEIAFTKSELLQWLKDAPATPVLVSRRVNSATGLNVRLKPSAQNNVPILRVLPFDTRIRTYPTIVQADGFAWAELEERNAWIATDWTVLADETSAPLLPVKTSKGGINIDLMYAATSPSPQQLSGIKYARFVYNVSRAAGNYGNDSVAVAHNRFGEYIAQLIANNITPILILNHEMYGEGAGFNWERMSQQDWEHHRANYIGVLAQIVNRYGASVVYQIWNEPDQTSMAAVGLSPSNFARLLDDSIDTIRAVAPTANVITGGLVSGKVDYWAQTRNLMRNAKHLAGLAVHPYGHVPNDGNNYRSTLGVVFGKLRDLINAYAPIAPKQTLWFTEWGVTGDANRNEPPSVSEAAAAAYMRAFMRELDQRVIAACYFAWSDGQHSTLGIVQHNGTRREQMWKSLLLT